MHKRDPRPFRHPEQPRAITLREAMRLHTLPEKTQLSGTLDHMATQVGNAVPTRLVEVVSDQILKLYEGLVSPTGRRRTHRAPVDGLVGDMDVSGIPLGGGHDQLAVTTGATESPGRVGQPCGRARRVRGQPNVLRASGGPSDRSVAEDIRCTPDGFGGNRSLQGLESRS